MSALRARCSLRPVRAASRPRFLLVPLLLLAAIAFAQPAEAATAVSVKIGTAPKRISRATSATFAWKTHGTVLGTMCALDRQRFQRCSGRRLYKKLKNGLHTFRVEVIGVRATKRIATYKWRVDTLPPTAPIAAGGSLTWQGVASLPLTGSGSSDSGSGVLRYESRSSSDGGATWSAGAPGGLVTAAAVGETMAQFRAVDRAGNASAWSPAAGTAAATARIDRDAPSMPVVTGGSLQWQNAVTVDVVGAGSVDAGGAGVDHYEYRTSTDGGLLWSFGVAGNDASISALGETLVQFRAVDAAGNASLWAPLIDNGGNTVRLDRTIPTAPNVVGGTIGWQNIASTTVTASGGQDSFGSGVAGYEYRSSTDGGATWSSPAAGAALGISSEGETLVEFRSVDNASLVSSWTQVPVEIDRTNPTDPTVSGGSPAWQSVATLDIAGAGSSDAGGSGLVGYQVRSSTDGGVSWTAAAAGTHRVVSAEGETLVELRAIDGAGNASAWVQDTARIDRTLPTAPVVSGGSLSWQSVASVAVSASGSTDGGGSGLSGYEYRSSTDGGATWSVATGGASD
ncbi:MAG: large repetitive protein, partial [Gaiellales bacterium]|nr:large repetitive protein [Gaiellales bacterium]